jgi:alkylated DNA nucleotide flippase Atl1
MPYGEVAAAIGSRSARGVGRVMAHGGHDVPWWRVVRASGHPADGLSARALEHYRAEGTPLRFSASGDYRVDLAAARYRPEL